MVNPWVHDFSYFHLWAQPLFLYSLAGHLRRAGYRAELLDCLDPPDFRRASRRDREIGIGPLTKVPIEKPAALADLARRYFQYGIFESEFDRRLSCWPPPRLILISTLMTYWYPGVRHTVERLRRHFPETPLYLGGKYVEILPEHAAATPAIDGLIGGDDFAAVVRRLADLLGDERLASDAPLPPLPPGDFFSGRRGAALFLGRGCPGRCPYCLYSARPAGVVRHDASAVAAWILDLAERFGLSHFAFLDDALLYRWPQGLGAVLEKVLARRDDLSFHCPNGLSLSAIDGDLARLLWRANFRTLRLAVETLSGERGAELGGKWSGDDLERCLDELARAGIARSALGAYLLVGLPGQGRGEIEAGVESLLQLGIRPHLAEYSPLPGTALWQRALTASPYPLASEPLTHNKTLLPCRAADYTLPVHEALKEKIRGHFGTTRAGASAGAEEPGAGKVVRSRGSC